MADRAATATAAFLLGGPLQRRGHLAVQDRPDGVVVGPDRGGVHADQVEIGLPEGRDRGDHRLHQAIQDASHAPEANRS
ncbi:hypothetical protein [Planomonospora venezuelensis]|uniref:Uncharacterized protein n=1 Tax=Planomonospora venezuelensis TaxID=1999 RepID=A0A841D926_PLAVE|nr:hypothetical protein [Planomonospora venezuelensis]GIN04116.1 hypothetical protein Pve01_57740 [Planomonospora venezuelensis]